jgi:hypothetical protein
MVEGFFLSGRLFISLKLSSQRYIADIREVVCPLLMLRIYYLLDIRAGGADQGHEVGHTEAERGHR